MTTTHKSGYAILRAKVKEQQEKIDNLQKDLDNTVTLNKAALNRQSETIKRREEEIVRLKERCRHKDKVIDELHVEVAARDERIKRLHEIIDEHKAHEAWLYRHTPWVIRLWYIKHFGL